MKIDILTIFPDFFRGPLDYGIVRRRSRIRAPCKRTVIGDQNRRH